MHSAGGWRVLHCSGNLSNGTQAGLTYLNANNTSSNYDVNISAHSDAESKKKIELECIKTLALAKTYTYPTKGW